MTTPFEPVQVIAEIGCNHKGDMDIAKELIRVAAGVCKADIAKFQKRTNRELLTPEEYDRPHPVPENAYGDTYGAHREFLEFDTEQHRELIEECKTNGIKYSTSVWDLTSAKEMSALNPPLLKIPSATNQHFELQGYLCENYAGEIHVSTGMSTGDEIKNLVEFYEERGRAQDLVVYSCTSGYPVAFQDICLFEIAKLMDIYGPRVKGIGFSGHHLGIAADVAALAVGQMKQAEGKGKFSHIERHFTLDRTWKGTDHAASLEPDGMRRLCRDLKNVNLALTNKDQDILPVEQVQRDKLKWVKERHGDLVAE
ncbi:N-acetylneuraminate synthase family protein [Psychromarinibacter halotolerans]|uniref:N-acetylneuraminate synthase family protein n=1 Tax=Psychromarinibacter halotolerans TaxID=1775175 RepID=A0ABV7GHY5_9RHOB|nr:N-acetylneuraminate synthase family protein [Psychromarinibacter halotolerans]MAQ84549.1 N-acetylneuraminate synthase [Maritimibacter sp.]MAQ84583.1 N-acetylneuraminate synthase [Maritimibacter sp.]MDF0598920.1 N-acetylneuraminate synthase family protein [Psychromarinibacter halotolerans]